MRCPKCPDQAMRLETWPGVEFERCPRCQGIFLDEGELQRLLVAWEAAHADTLGFTELSERQDLQEGTCDRCRVRMLPYLGPRNMRLDRCPRCGSVFLDQGELAEMRQGSTPGRR